MTIRLLFFILHDMIFDDYYLVSLFNCLYNIFKKYNQKTL